MGDTMTPAMARTRPIKACIVVLPERPAGLNLQALENQLRVAVERSGRFVVAVHFCGLGQPSFIASKMKQSDEVILYSVAMDTFQMVDAYVLRRLLGDRAI
jgi:hypothetical protein